MRQLFQVLVVALSTGLMLGPTAMPAHSSDATLPASELLLACTTPDESWISFCNGYMQAAFDYAVLEGLACAREGLTRTDLTVLFEREAALALVRNRNSLEAVDGFVLAVSIFSENLACNQP